MSAFSFNGNEIITTLGGGAVISNDEQLIKKACFIATQARDKASDYQHSQIGYYYRMSNVLAGIGRGQMEVLEERIKKRRENFKFISIISVKPKELLFLKNLMIPFFQTIGLQLF